MNLAFDSLCRSPTYSIQVYVCIESHNIEFYIAFVANKAVILNYFLHKFL